MNESLVANGWQSRATDLVAFEEVFAALLADLDGLGLLQDRLVVCTGEFGRTPNGEGQEGRDHNTNAFTLWMAGGGVRGGFTYSRSDEYGYQAVENPVPKHPCTSFRTQLV